MDLLIAVRVDKRARIRAAVSALAVPAALLFVALLTRLDNLGAASFWFDEAISWSVASSPWSVLLTAQQEPHPPLYYAFLKLWMFLGTSEATLRLPTAIVGVVDVALVYALARRWGGARAGAIGGLLLALSPLHVWYAREARMYEFVAAAAVGSTLLLVRWWSAARPRAMALWLGFYSLVALVGLYLNYNMLLVIAVQAIAVVGAGRWRRSAAFLIALVAVVAGYVPWLPTALTHLNLVRGAHFQGYADRLTALTGVAVSGDLLLASLAVVPTVLFFIAALRGRAIWSWLHRSAARPGMALGLVFVPVALLVVFGDAPRALTVKRQILPLVPLALALAAIVVDRQPRRRLIVAVLVLLGLPGVWLGVVHHEIEPWRDVAALVQAEAKPNDLVLVHVLYAEPAFRYYYHGMAPARPAPYSVGGLPAAVGASQRVWLVLSRWQGPTDPFVTWFDRSWRLVGAADRPPLGLRLYERPSS